MLTQGLRVFGIILGSQGLKGEGRLTTKRHRTNAHPSPLETRVIDVEIDEGGDI
jgi:hypothetical protein